MGSVVLLVVCLRGLTECQLMAAPRVGSCAHSVNSAFINVLTRDKDAEERKLLVLEGYVCNGIAVELQYGERT